MKEKISDFFYEHDTLLGIIVFASIVSAIFLLCFFVFDIGRKADDRKWNNGFCECGGKYSYEQAIGHKIGTTFIYRCSECGHMIEVSEAR